MKPTALSLLFVGLVSAATAADLQTDIKQPQSPTRPAPKGLKLIDHGQFDPRLKGYIAPEGFRIEIVAEQPTIINPAGIRFGTDGSLYVLEWLPSLGDEWRETPEWFTFKDGTKRAVATMKKGKKDVLKVVKWNPEKKLYDRAEVIVEDELPSSVMMYDGWVYMASRGTVRRYRQSKPGGPYDVKEVIAQGFCGFHHHQVSGVTLGPDGWLYITSGDDDNFAEGSDGSRATVLRTGAVFRCRPDGSKMHTYSLGYRNPYRDVVFDVNANIFHVDNDNEDGSKFTGCRLMHVAEEADFGWRLFTGARCCRPDHVRGAVFGELPGKMPAMLKTGRGSPAGLLSYNDTQFPEMYRGLLIYPDVFRKLVRAYRVAPVGSTFEVVEEFEFLKSDEPLFRPCHAVVGPDGAIYVCDWRTDSGGAGKLWGDGQHGRIYRISWRGTEAQPEIPLRPMDSWAKYDAKASFETLAEGIASPEFSIRQQAHQELVRRAAKNPKEVQALALKGATAEAGQLLSSRLLFVGALNTVWNDEVRKVFIKLLSDREPDVVRLAADGLALNCKTSDEEVSQELAKALATATPPAKRAIILALGRIAAPGAEDILINVFRADDGRDPYYSDACLRALERLDNRGMRRLIDLADSGVDKDRDRVVEGFLTLRTRASIQALPALMKNTHLKPTQKADLIKSFGNYLFDPPLTAEPLIAILLQQTEAPTMVKMAGLEALALFPAVQNKPMADLLIRWSWDPDPEMRLAAITTIEKSRLSQAVPDLIERVADEKWTHFERAAIVKALRTFGDPKSIPPLTKIVAASADATPEAKTLRLEAFRSLALLDRAAALPHAMTFLDQTGEFQTEAIQVLAARADGAKIVAERFLAKKLPRELLPQVADGLRRHVAKEPELGKLLTDVMKGGLLVSLDKAEVARIQGLIKTKGDPRRGRELFLNAKTLACITCHKLEGIGGAGGVGPDLTRVWETISLEKIMESMIEPSKEIKEGYQAYVLETKSGLTHTGLRIAQTPTTVTLRDSNGKELTLPLKDVESLTASKQSLMPDNVISQLSFDQFLDLVAFLKSQPAQESLRGLPLEYWVAGPFPEELSKPFGPEKNPDPKAVYESPKNGEKIQWQRRSTEPSGYLDFRAAFHRDRISAYALTYVYSPKDQKALLFTGSKDQMRVWVGGKQVQEYTQRRPVRPDAESVGVQLRAGWTPVLVKVLNGTGAHGFFLRFQGDGLRVSPEAK